MKIYKDKQFLVFDLDDGSTVKYDFSINACIGKKGKSVNNLCTQLQGLTIDELCDNCTDAQYGKFLRFVKRYGGYNGQHINNIGTILKRVQDFCNFEQLFSAGFEKVDPNFKYKINDIPKGLIKLCRTHEITLTDYFLELYKEIPDSCNLAYNLQYDSLNDKDIYNIFTCKCSVAIPDERSWTGYRCIYASTFRELVNKYGYTAKPLMFYIDNLKTYEAIDNVSSLMNEIYDYASMMSKISNKFDRYPRHFLTTHKIACRNYNRLKEQFDEDAFKNRIDKSMERNFGKYRFIYPNSTQDIKNEAVQQNNCVASYIKRVIDGQCHILFLRLKDNPDESLVTIEVRNNQIVQAKRRFNYPVTDEEQDVIDRWNRWRMNQIKESEELKYAG